MAEKILEDFTPKLEFTSLSRTIIEGELVNYIAITGDYNQSKLRTIDKIAMSG